MRSYYFHRDDKGAPTHLSYEQAAKYLMERQWKNNGCVYPSYKASWKVGEYKPYILAFGKGEKYVSD